MSDTNTNELNTFRGWLAVFLLMHVPIALYNVTGGLTLAGNLLKAGAAWWFALLNILLSLLLPAALLLLLKRNRLCRWIYVLYIGLTAVNYLIQHGINVMNVSVAVICAVPWTLYLFRSKRVSTVLRDRP